MLHKSLSYISTHFSTVLQLYPILVLALALKDVGNRTWEKFPRGSSQPQIGCSLQRSFWIDQRAATSNASTATQIFDGRIFWGCVLHRRHRRLIVCGGDSSTCDRSQAVRDDGPQISTWVARLRRRNSCNTDAWRQSILRGL